MACTHPVPEQAADKNWKAGLPPLASQNGHRNRNRHRNRRDGEHSSDLAIFAGQGFRAEGVDKTESSFQRNVLLQGLALTNPHIFDDDFLTYVHSKIS